jgi:hypothetical protein
MKTAINNIDAEWPPFVLRHWQQHVEPLFEPGERCTFANYFTARPYRNEWDRGNNSKTGFTYVVQPGDKVCWFDFPKDEVTS